MKTHFDHEKLDVHQEAIAFCGWVGELRQKSKLRQLPKINLIALRPVFPSTSQKEMASSLQLIALVFWKLLAGLRWSVLHASMCLRFESLLLLNGSFLARKG